MTVQEMAEISCSVRARIPTRNNGEWFLHLYDSAPSSTARQPGVTNGHHLALVYGSKLKSSTLNAQRKDDTELKRKLRGATPISIAELASDSINKGGFGRDVLVRVHSACFTGESLCSFRCDCGEQLQNAMGLIMQQGSGVIVYLAQEGRGIGLEDKLKAYNLQDLGYDTVSANLELEHPADARDYLVAALILRDLQVQSVRLMTNNPDKLQQLDKYGITVTNRIPLLSGVAKLVLSDGPVGLKQQQDLGDIKQESEELSFYLQTKVARMGHLM